MEATSPHLPLLLVFNGCSLLGSVVKETPTKEYIWSCPRNSKAWFAEATMQIADMTDTTPLCKLAVMV